jgi:hypothetical protein
MAATATTPDRLGPATGPDNLLRIADLGPDQLRHLLDLAAVMKRQRIRFRKAHTGSWHGRPAPS